MSAGGKAPLIMFAGIVFLAVGAASALVADSVGSRHRSDDSREFQALIGGLGLGPSTELGRCEFGFDLRLAGACRHDVGPIAGGMFFCPDHACSVMLYPPLLGPQPFRARQVDDPKSRPDAPNP